MPETPATPMPDPNRPFEIGLVMAGAVSAGAYTAGVIDFLVEALDEWEAAKAQARADHEAGRPNDCPLHDVKIKVMAGASAGGMTAGLAAGLLGMEFQSVTAQPADGQKAEPENNNLYRSWVNTIDIAPLLGARDLAGAGGPPLQSVLDSSILQEIARDAFAFEDPKKTKARPYVADPLHVILTVTNLRGVPYAPDFENWSKTTQYEMMMHADNMHFILSANQPPAGEGAFWLRPHDFDDAETWGVLQTAALATGAFPVGLAPQLLTRPPGHYQTRRWAMPGPHEEGGVHYCQYWQEIPPFWPDVEKAKDFQYQFLCVDGGVMNNEPLDHARRVLAGPSGATPNGGDQATRAVIMIMPFPNATPYPLKYDGRLNLFRQFSTTFNSLIAQARFKPEELALAHDPNVFSRFLVVPRRGFRPDGTLEPNTIACGSLHGFGGFLSRRFREHDYQLGRRNCQWFLQQYFALPKTNRLFEGHWTPAAIEKFEVRRAVPSGDGSTPGGSTTPGERLGRLPLIPLVGKAVELIPQPTWPSLTEKEFRALQAQVKDRLGRVADTLIDQNIEGLFWGPLARGALKSAWWFQRGNVINYVMNFIRQDLTGRGLMP